MNIDIVFKNENHFYLEYSKYIGDPIIGPTQIHPYPKKRRDGTSTRILNNIVELLFRGLYVILKDDIVIPDGNEHKHLIFKEELLSKLKRRFETEHQNEKDKILIIKVGNDIYVKIEGINPI